MPKHVILFLAANPSGTSPLKLEQECSEIQRELRMADHRDDFVLESRWAVSVDDVMRQVNELQPAVLHFSGHGDHNTGLVLHDEHGTAQAVAPTALASMIEATASNVRVIVLNACYSDEQAYLLKHTVDCIVGMAGSIPDEDARAYAVGFYRALGYRRSIAIAHKQAIATVYGRRSPPPADSRSAHAPVTERAAPVTPARRDVIGDEPIAIEAFAPVLLAREGVDPDKLTLTPAVPLPALFPWVFTVAALGLTAAGVRILHGYTMDALVGVLSISVTFMFSFLIATRLARSRYKVTDTPILGLLYHVSAVITVGVTIVTNTYLWLDWPVGIQDEHGSNIIVIPPGLEGSSAGSETALPQKDKPLTIQIISPKNNAWVNPAFTVTADVEGDKVTMVDFEIGKSFSKSVKAPGPYLVQVPEALIEGKLSIRATVRTTQGQTAMAELSVSIRTPCWAWSYEIRRPRSFRNERCPGTCVSVDSQGKSPHGEDIPRVPVHDAIFSSCSTVCVCLEAP